MTQDASGALSWATSQLDIGEHSVVLVASQGNTTIRQDFRLQVVGATGNKQPVIAPLTVPAANADQPFTLDLDGFDPEGSALTFFAQNRPAGASMSASTGLLTWTPPASLAGQTLTMRVGARDTSGLQVSADIQVHVIAQGTVGINHPPEITSRALIVRTKRGHRVVETCLPRNSRAREGRVAGATNRFRFRARRSRPP
jgi:hypothetical protein